MEIVDRSPALPGAPFYSAQIADPSARVAEINAALDALEGALSLGERDRFVARLCLDEAITNACEHGELETSDPVEISLTLDPPGWILRVCDSGPGYDPVAHSEREVDPLAEGGRGLPILDGYGERLILANRGREVTVWLRVAAEEATS